MPHLLVIQTRCFGVFMLFSPLQNEVAQSVVTLAQSGLAQDQGEVVSFVMQVNWEGSCLHDLINV